MQAETAAVPLLAVGYACAVPVIVRWLPVVREQRTRWFALHAAGMAALVAGWAVRRPAATLPNAAWLVISTVWYVAGGRGERGDRR